jgi:hypothetical protein
VKKGPGRPTLAAIRDPALACFRDPALACFRDPALACFRLDSEGAWPALRWVATIVE